jgi:hypothetical protein
MCIKAQRAESTSYVQSTWLAIVNVNQRAWIIQIDLVIFGTHLMNRIEKVFNPSPFGSAGVTKKFLLEGIPNHRDRTFYVSGVFNKLEESIFIRIGNWD